MSLQSQPYQMSCIFLWQKKNEKKKKSPAALHFYSLGGF